MLGIGEVALLQVDHFLKIRQRGLLQFIALFRQVALAEGALKMTVAETDSFGWSGRLSRATRR